ncbi:MAG TPA: ABC transporter substrate-binding protein [Chloroflexota bacterium]|nr:ABC transporter substrate-binding protein [Chloroflexota bacterium]
MSLKRRDILIIGGTAFVPLACGPAGTTAEPRGTPAAGTTAATAATGATPAQQPRKGGVLRASTLGGLPRVFHPYPEAQLNTTPHSDAWTLMGASLISIDWDKLDFRADPRTDLAREMPRISNGGRTYTFTLRDNIKWSDGRPITAADFLFAWENARKPENNWVALTSVVERTESLTTPDEKTVELTLKQPLARLLGLTIAASYSPMPKHIWEGKPWLDPGGNPEILMPTVVPGPYLPKEVNAELHRYARNPNWWGKETNLDEIVFLNGSVQTVLELLKTRQAEWAQSFPPAQFQEAKQIPHATVYDWTGGVASYRLMQFNLKRPNLSELQFREALVRAINRADLVQFEDDLAEPQFGLYPNKFSYASQAVERFDYDLNRAKSLLQQAGYTLDGSVLKDKSGQPVKLEILWPTTSQPRGKMATYAQQQWRQLGIEVTVTGMEFNAFVDRYQRQRDFDVVMGSFSQSSIDPDGIKSQYATNGSQNATGYSNQRVDELLEQGAVEQDEQRRRQIYDEIQKIAVAELPHFQMLSLKSFTAFDKNIQGVLPLKGGDILRQSNSQFMDWFSAV